MCEETKISEKAVSPQHRVFKLIDTPKHLFDRTISWCHQPKIRSDFDSRLL